MEAFRERFQEFHETVSESVRWGKSIADRPHHS